jgi:hypothetical protein
VELVVGPRVCRVDTVPSLAVRGAQGPGAPGSGTTDAAGHRWRSSGEYAVGRDGALVIDDAERPWWDMAFADAGAAPVAFTAPGHGAALRPVGRRRRRGRGRGLEFLADTLR